MSQKFINPWDATQAITGSVYSATPTYVSGAEGGLAVFTAPSSKFFTPEIGAPARHMNWALKALGDVAVQGLQHQAMRFVSAKDWGTVLDAAYARTNRGFVAAVAGTVSFSRDGRNTGAAALTPTSSTITSRVLLHDDGFHILDLEVEPGLSSKIASSTTVTSSQLAGGDDFYPNAAVTVGTTTLLVGTTGLAVTAYTYSGTATTPATSTVSIPGGTYSVTTTAIWGSCQVFEGATTATGPALIYQRGDATKNYLKTADGATLTSGTMSTAANKLADIAYDADQSLYIAALYSSTGSVVKFATSPDGVTWTTSTTATGPANLPVPSGAADGSVAFKITAGVWFLALTSGTFSHYVNGLSAGNRVVGMYSLDYGVTWHVAALDMASSTAGKLKIVTTPNRILVKTDTDLSVSGIIGYPETL